MSYLCENDRVQKVLSLCVLAAALARVGWGVELEGTLVVSERGSPIPLAEEHRLAVVWYEPSVPGPPPQPRTVEIVTRRKQFQPRLVVIPVGSTVRFPNEDPILHNVFSVHPQNHFDLGLHGRGPGKEVRFQHPGIVAVFCNVHHAMFAHVVVVGTPYFTQPDASGRFRLEAIPEGAGVVKAWHERGEVFEQRITVPSGPLRIDLALTRPRIPPHKNKLGKPYAGTRYGG